MKTLINKIDQAIQNGNSNILTLKNVSSLKGKRIQTKYFGYASQYGINEFVVGEVVSEYDLAKKEQLDGFKNRAEYWESYMTPAQIAETKRKLILCDDHGNSTNIYAYERSGEFWCSDDFRNVYFVEL